MKDKVLKTEITSHVEAIARALRNYAGTDQQLCLDLFIQTRRNVNGCDQYEVCVFCPDEGGVDYVMETEARIFYKDDEFGCEGIYKTETIGDEEDE